MNFFAGFIFLFYCLHAGYKADCTNYFAQDMTGITCKDLGEYFGGDSEALITMMRNRIADESRKNKRLKGRINKIRKQIVK